jgi:hypothetical protein
MTAVLTAPTIDDDATCRRFLIGGLSLAGLSENDPVYQSLKIAREGRVVFLGGGDQATLAAAVAFGTVWSLPFTLDGLLPTLAAALDGNPATR